MSIKLIANDAFVQAARFQVTDSSNVVVSDSKQLNAVGGGRHLSFVQSGTTQRRFAYVNKTTDFDVDTFVMVRADRHVGQNIQIGYWTSYPGGTWNGLITSVTWAPTLVGYASQDFVSSVALGANEALGLWLASTYAKTVSQVYWGKSLEFEFATAFTLRDLWQTVRLGRKAWACSQMITFTLQNLTRAEVERLEQIEQMREPVFLWDSGGKVLSDTLWHGVIATLQLFPRYDDTHDAQINFARLRGYS